MKNLKRSLVFIIFLLLALSHSASAAGISPIVSTDWLAKNLKKPGLIVLDIRKVERYREGHIPGAVSAYYGIWAETREQTHTEVPAEDDLFDAMRYVGIKADSHVVIVCQMDVCQNQLYASRVYCTLKYGGLKNVSILDGGHDQWVREKRPLSTQVVKAAKSTYTGTLDKSLLADKDYVKSRLGKAVFVDVRERPIFTGEKKQQFVERAGHIPGAVNMPMTQAFTEFGLFKSRKELEEIARKNVGVDKTKDIVTYCDAGKCCPTWAFILRDVLGYKNVRLYDGSFEEWSKDTSLPVSR
jgi:thiosulfate/3-mercaptopyruvate sulfurtransferase